MLKVSLECYSYYEGTRKDFLRAFPKGTELCLEGAIATPAGQRGVRGPAQPLPLTHLEADVWPRAKH